MAPFINRLSNDELFSRVLYRDALILVLNKPAGIPVHKAGPGLHNLEQYFPILQFGLKRAPSLAHRLDRDTSGCLVLARHTQAARKMQELFSQGHVKKAYLAIVHGEVVTDRGRIDISLGRQSQQKSNWRMKPDPLGTITAITDYEVLKRSKDNTLLKLVPHTGRTHQLRVHCAALGHSIIGDTIYGVKGDKISHLHLHAHEIAIPLYPKKPPIVVSAPLPSHMESYNLVKDSLNAEN
jgi:tRNA pseudouridine32 synthase/23S rRNA pseudouridine746 synthase